tara:strand:- start:6361 stop:6855 length:495 start_codon:yes stop_codon:yes gene_type:complete
MVKDWYTKGMIPLLASIIVPLVAYVWVRPLFEEKYPRARRHRVLLVMASLTYFIAWYLPSPMIDGMNTALWTHVTGGVTAGFVWLYLQKSGVWKVHSPWIQIVILYAIVSALGVANELAEFILVKVNIFPISLADTSYDLVANTLGAAAFLIAYEIVKYVKIGR